MTVVNSDRAGTDGIDFGGPGETWIINPGVYVWGSAIGVSSIYDGSTLKNSGQVLSANTGVDFVGNSQVINNAGGFIEGQNAGVEFDASLAKSRLVNHGVIASADDAVLFSTTTNGVSLDNTGKIIGEFYGIYQNSGDSGGTIVNSGVIRCGPRGLGVDAINITTATGLTTFITNTLTGVIAGPNAIRVEAGAFSLINFGKIVGPILDNADLADRVVNRGKVQGAVDLGGGADLFNGSGGTSGAVFGDAGRDRLIGGPRADLLHGGDDLDRLTGNAGADKFFFDTAGALTSVDTITDFTPAQGDRIVLSAGVFTGIGAPGPLAAAHFRAHPHAVNPSQHILYNPSNGSLFYDQDGSGSTYAPIQFASLSTHPALTSVDFLVIA